MKKYMAFDLVTLTIIGFILEFIIIKFGANVILGVPTIGVSILIVFLATVRWNFWGLLTIPGVVLGTLLGGYLCDTKAYAAAYDWKMYISVVLAYTIMVLNPISFKLIGTKKLVDTPLKIVGVLLLDYILINSLIFIIYGAFSGDPFKLHYSSFRKGTEDVRGYTVQDCFTYNLLGLALSAIGLIILRSQGIVCNAKEKFVDDRKNTELDRIDRDFRISFSEDEAVKGDTDSSKKENEDEQSS